MKLAGLFKSFESSMQEAKQTFADLERRLEAARRRREELVLLPPPKSDVLQLLTQHLDRQAARWPARLQELIQYHLFRNMTMDTGAVNEDFWHAGDFLVSAEPGKRPESGDVSVALAYIFKDQLREGMQRAVAEMPDWEAGPPRAERARELAELDREIASMEKELREMTAAAAAAGFTGLSSRRPS